VLLEVQKLSASYAGSMALSSVSMTLPEGQIIGLCGANKAGKSTLCKCLAGTKTPDTGDVLLEGAAITALPAFRRLPLGISLCPEGRGIYPGMTVEDNLRVGCDGIPRREHKSRMGEVLRYFPILGERLAQPAGTLSGGEAQMLGISKKLLRRPRVLIVDEPSLGLAPRAIHAVYSALTQIRKDFGVTVLVVEEVITRLEGWVDRAYVLHLGQIVAAGLTRELMGSAVVAAAFTGQMSTELHEGRQ
jgi:branched-chain amino acid transport system ATP-binding protein